MIDFDFEWYRSVHPDLARFSDHEIREHYETHGRTEGRPTSPLALREYLTKEAEKSEKVLEIGPFCNPAILGPNVKYFDVLDKEGLVKRAHQLDYEIRNVPNIDFISPDADMSVVNEKFTSCFSSHCVEHMPDLVRHFEHVDRILEDGGLYYLLIPDKRYCFDHYIPESSLARVVDAHHRQKRSHDLQSVLEHRAFLTHNDPARHWRGDHFDQLRSDSFLEQMRSGLAEYIAADGRYIDVHAWQFTPENFRLIVSSLFELGMTKLQPERVFETPFGRHEFAAILRSSTKVDPRPS